MISGSDLAAVVISTALVFGLLGWGLGLGHGRLDEIDERAKRERIEGKEPK